MGFHKTPRDWPDLYQEKGQGQPLLREAVTQPQSPADSVKGPEQIRAAHLLYNPHPLPRTPPASSPKREGRAGPKLIQPAQSRDWFII